MKLLRAILILLVLGCQFASSTSRGSDLTPWRCSATVVHRRTGKPIPDVRVALRSKSIGITNWTGKYVVRLSPGPATVDTMRFRKLDWHDGIGVLDSARAIGDHRLALDVTMLGGKEGHWWRDDSPSAEFTRRAVPSRHWPRSMEGKAVISGCQRRTGLSPRVMQTVADQGISRDALFHHSSAQ